LVTYGKRVLSKQLKELTPSKIEGVNHKEATELLLPYLSRGGALRLEGGQIQQWAGSHWEELSNDGIEGEILEHFGHLAAAKKQND
jgi:hypothetical protein